jgi:hypothetical protein
MAPFLGATDTMLRLAVAGSAKKTLNTRELNALAAK